MHRSIGVLIIASMVLMNIGMVNAVEDYLAVPEGGYTINPKETIKSGEPIVVDITLKRVSETLPEESRLIVTTNMVGPWAKITIDGNVQTFTKNEIEIPLPDSEKGVKEILIYVTGKAPTVEKLTQLTVVDVKTYVRYTGVEGVYQEEIGKGPLTLEVTNPKITETVNAINTAKEKCATAESIINGLKTKGVNTVDLEAQLVDAKTLIDLADQKHEEGKLDEAKTNAGLAINALDRIISDARALEAGRETQTGIKKYLTILAAVIVIVVAIFFIKGRREELG